MSNLRTRSFRNISKSEENICSPLLTSDSRVFEELVPQACTGYDSRYGVFIRKEIIQEDAYLKLYEADMPKVKRAGKKATALSTSTLNASEEVAPTAIVSTIDYDYEDHRSSNDLGLVVITARYDAFDRFREIYIDNVVTVDNTTITVIGLVVPQFTYLRKITIKRSGINPVTIHQLSKMLLVTHITELCLDDLRLPEANYYTLLDETSSLKSLSLCRSQINDDVCREICSRLHYLKAAETHLALLDLTSNDITDVGAKYFALALRSNRHLRYLNLLGNKICDEGACSIFESLMDFPLTAIELDETRLRNLKYRKRRGTVSTLRGFSPYLDDRGRASVNTSTKRTGKSKKKKVTKSQSSEDKTSLSSQYSSRSRSTDVRLVSMRDPFNANFTRIKGNKVYCTGNLSLVYLNLGYNNISYIGIKKLAEVCTYQRDNLTTDTPGLLRVIIDGNYLPVECPELATIEQKLKM